MKIPCEDIASYIKKDLAKKTQILKKSSIHPKLVTILVGESAAQLSFVAIKEKVAKDLGIGFEFIHIKQPPAFLKFANTLRDLAKRDDVTGIIIQQPLPTQLHSDTLYNYIPAVKEIEGHRKKTPYLPPLGLTVVTVLKYACVKSKIGNNLYPDLKTDQSIFKQCFKHKKIVLMGRGITGGAPIGHTLSQFRINYIGLNSKTFDPEQYLKEADVIITAIGKKVVTPDMLKAGVTLINVGVHKNAQGKLRGDYYEEEIKKIAGSYTTTPKGTGPIDVLFLYNNLLQAASTLAK